MSAQIVRDAVLLHPGSASVACLIRHVAWRGEPFVVSRGRISPAERQASARSLHDALDSDKKG